MAIDQEGYKSIKQAFELDKAKARERHRKELEKEYASKKYIGTPELQEQARVTDRIRMAQQLKERLALDMATLEKAHFGELGETHALDMAKKEHRIQTTQAKWRGQEQDPKSVPFKKVHYENSLTTKYNEQGEQGYEQAQQSKEQHAETLKDQWREADQNKGVEKDEGIDI